MIWLLVGLVIGINLGAWMSNKKIREKANAYKRGYGYRLPLWNKLYVVMEDQDYQAIEQKLERSKQNGS